MASYRRDAKSARERGDKTLGLAMAMIPRKLFHMAAKPKPGNPFENNPLARAILREGLLIQDRFSAEPVYAKPGKGYLKSVRVEEIATIKNASRKTGS